MVWKKWCNCAVGFPNSLLSCREWSDGTYHHDPVLAPLYAKNLTGLISTSQRLFSPTLASHLSASQTPLSPQPTPPCPPSPPSERKTSIQLPNSTLSSQELPSYQIHYNRYTGILTCHKKISGIAIRSTSSNAPSSTSRTVPLYQIPPSTALSMYCVL